MLSKPQTEIILHKIFTDEDLFQEIQENATTNEENTTRDPFSLSLLTVTLPLHSVACHLNF